MRRAVVASLAVVATIGSGLAWSVSEDQTSGAAGGAATHEPSPGIDAITALGRLEPPDGVLFVAGPSEFAVVVAKLFVEENDFVTVGQEIGRLDTYDTRAAEVALRRARLANTRVEQSRAERLFRDEAVSESERDSWRTKAEVDEAALQKAEAGLRLAVVRAPVAGQVLKIHTHAGERIGPEGILEIGRTTEMRAIAEVYETDVGRVKLAQRATITSPALHGPFTGEVVKIRPKVAKQDLLKTDPIARTDARVVEVEIALERAEELAAFTNLQVDVAITP